MDNVEYPVEILPNSGYVASMDTASLLAYDGVHIHRRSDLEKDKCFFNGVVDRFHFRSNVLAEAFKNPFNLSVNLLGGKFIPELHAHWRPLRPGSDDWNGEDDIDLVKFQTCYKPIEGDFPHFYFAFKDVNGKKLNYPRTFPKPEAAAAYKVFETLDEEVDSQSGLEADEKSAAQNEIQATAVLQLCHRPTNLNYWHWQVESATYKKVEDPETGEEVITMEDTIEKNKKTAWGKELLKSQIEYLWSCVKFSCVDCMIIPQELYLK